MSNLATPLWPFWHAKCNAVYDLCDVNEENNKSYNKYTKLFFYILVSINWSGRGTHKRKLTKEKRNLVKIRVHFSKGRQCWCWHVMVIMVPVPVLAMVMERSRVEVLRRNSNLLSLYCCILGCSFASLSKKRAHTSLRLYSCSQFICKKVRATTAEGVKGSLLALAKWILY